MQVSAISIIVSGLLVVFGAFVTVYLGGMFTGWLVRPYGDQLEDDEGLEDAGWIIGMSERSLIYVLVWADAPTAIGFLVTAKSIFRFGDVTDSRRKHAEYVIIGTLISFAYAVTASYLFRWLYRTVLPRLMTPPGS